MTLQWVPGAWWSALALSIAVLAAYTSLDMARRVQTARHGAGPRWLVGAAIALGTGIVSVHVILFHAVPMDFPLGYNPWAIGGVWMAAMLISLVGLGLAGGRLITPQRLAAGVGVLGAGTVGCQMGAMSTLGLRPGVQWQPLGVALALVTAGAGIGLALWVFFHVRLKLQRHPYRWQAVAGVLLGVAGVLSEGLLIGAADLAEQTFSAFDLKLPAAILVGLGTLGSIALLG